MIFSNVLSERPQPPRGAEGAILREAARFFQPIRDSFVAFLFEELGALVGGVLIEVRELVVGLPSQPRERFLDAAPG
jgi:hypothetical protein